MIDLTKVTTEQLYRDLVQLDSLEWIYGIAVDVGHYKSQDGTVDYVERLGKVKEMKVIIKTELKKRGEER